jgi:hypothetical protein
MTKFRYLRISIFRVLILYAASATGQTGNPSAAPVTAPTATAAPCKPAAAPKPCGFVCREEAKAAESARRAMCKATKGNQCDLPGPNDWKGEAKPCPASTPDNKPVAPAAAPVPAAVPESERIISDDGKLLYICPKGSTKAAEYPICERPDGNVFPMIAIPLPPVGGPKKLPISDGPGAVNAKPGSNANSLSQPVTGTTQNQNPASGAQK